MVGCAVVGRAVVGRAVGVRCDGMRRGGESRGGGAPWWGALWWGMLWGCTVVGRDAGNLYLKQGKSAKWVEKPNPAVRKSLPKQPFLLGKGRDSKPHLPEIST